MNKTILFIVTLIMMSACKNTFNSKEELIKYINDEENGLKKAKKIGNIELTITYKPTDLLVYQDVYEQKNISDSRIMKSRLKYNEYMYFVLSMNSGNKEILSSMNNMENFSSMLQTFAFSMNDFVEIITSEGDTILIADYVYPRVYGMSRSTDMLFAFKRNELNNHRNFNFRIKDMGLGIGENRFKFKNKDISRKLELNLKNLK